MRIVGSDKLVKFWRRDPNSERLLAAGMEKTKRASWANPRDVTDRFANASTMSNNRAVFRFRGGRYRIIAQIDYHAGQVSVRFVGTHAEYDRIDARTI